MRKRKMHSNNLKLPDNLDIAVKCKQIWSFSSITWMIADYVINITAFAASIAAIAVEALIMDNTVWVIAFSTLAATLTFVGFAVNPKYKMRIYRKSCDNINASLIRYYEDSDNETTRQAVIDAIIYGEKLINSTYDVD